MRTRLMLLLLLFSGKALAFDFPIEVTEYIDSTKIVAYINKNDINKKLQWAPFDGPPPLSIADALQAVHKYIKLDVDFSNTSLTGIELKRIPHHEKSWHYIVRIKYKTNGVMQPHFFIVLMDGKVISALKEPDSIK